MKSINSRDYGIQFWLREPINLRAGNIDVSILLHNNVLKSLNLDKHKQPLNLAVILTIFYI